MMGSFRVYKFTTSFRILIFFFYISISFKAISIFVFFLYVVICCVLHFHPWSYQHKFYKICFVCVVGVEFFFFFRLARYQKYFYMKQRNCFSYQFFFSPILIILRGCEKIRIKSRTIENCSIVRYALTPRVPEN